MRGRLARPYRPHPVRQGGEPGIAVQLLDPVLGSRRRARTDRGVVRARRLQAIDTRGPQIFQSETLDIDAANGLKIYRANCDSLIHDVRGVTTM